MVRRGGILGSRRLGRMMFTVNLGGLMTLVGLVGSLGLGGSLWAGCSDDSGGENNAPDAAWRAVCGNGILEEGEECDDGAENSDLRPNACRSDCRLARCGDGVADQGEDCDGRDYAAKICQDLEDPTASAELSAEERRFTGGRLACTMDCRLDLSGCTRCGNGLAEEGEACDGSDLANQDCASVANKQDGELSCTAQCTFDTSGCHTCGDGVVEEAEDCEPGQDLGVTCRDLGWSWGRWSATQRPVGTMCPAAGASAGTGDESRTRTATGQTLGSWPAGTWGFWGESLGAAQHAGWTCLGAASVGTGSWIQTLGRSVTARTWAGWAARS